MEMKTIISASRRTDIPAFYMEWLIQGIRRGAVEVENPFSRRRFEVSLDPDEVAVIVFWSKDFSKFLEHREYFSRYNLYFQFTINDCSSLEPGLPGLDERLKQLTELVRTYGPGSVLWRFDPIVFWNQGKENNAGSFRRIAEYVSGRGVKECVTSFATYYRKAVHCLKANGISYHDPDLSTKRETLGKLSSIAKDCGLGLSVCCQPEVLIEGVEASKCIDSGKLSSLFGVKLSRGKDTGQRESCLCNRSRDIGSYSQTCGHGCYYCYARGGV